MRHGEWRSLAGSALVYAAAFVTQPALARSQGEPVTTAGDAPALGEIVVTAQKRAQRTLDVPISITALSGEDLESGPVQDISDLFQVVPAVSGSANSSAQPLVAIRGIVSNDFSIGADPALGVYVDEVYTGRSAGAVQELVDVDRVEVVKGPQGTLYGRNTTAGAISIITPKPQLDRFSGRVTGAVGNFDQRELSLVVNAPIDEALGLRASGVYRTRDGVFDNALGGRRLDTVDRLAGRAALRFRPSDAVDFVLTVDGERDREDPTVAKSLTIAVPGDQHFGTVEGTPAINAAIRNDRDKYGVTLRADLELGDYSVTSISAARGYRLKYLEDTDGSALTQVHFGLDEKQDALSQEVRLNAPERGGFSWFIGASVYQETVSARSTATYDEDAICTGLAGTATPLGCDTVFRLTPSPDPAFATLFDYLLAVGVVSDPVVGATGQSESNDARGNYLSWGVYGDVTVELTDRLEFIAGARYSRDRKEIRLAAAPVVNTITLVSGGNAFLRAGSQRATETWGQFQPRAVLNFRPARDVLTYLSFTRGYKSGGFNVLQPGDPAFAPEKVTQFELGAKGSILDRRLQFELAAFNWRYSDLQVQVFDGGLPVVRNAGRAEAWGLDASVNALVTRGLQLVGSFSVLDAKYKQFNPQPGVDYAGNRPALAPEFSGRIGFVVTHDFPDAGTLRMNADYNYQSRVFFSPDNQTLRQDGFGLLSGRISYALPSDKVEFSLRGENLTNERYASSGQAIGTINLAQLRLGHPRLVTFDATFRW